jgi:hypothetical protein
VIDWKVFRSKCESKDEELFKIINDIETSDGISGPFQSLMN